LRLLDFPRHEVNPPLRQRPQALSTNPDPSDSKLCAPKDASKVVFLKGARVVVAATP
jgi:hypothetical protein